MSTEPLDNPNTIGHRGGALAGGKTTSILLVEDNPADVRLLELMLAETGREISLWSADSLAAGLATLDAQPIDVILLDLSLPDSQGLGTFEAVYRHCPELPIIVLSGMADETVATAAVKHGAQDYLVKGQVDGSLLMRSIRYAIERNRLDLAHRRMEARLQHSQKLESLGVLAGGIAHDFNNLLAAILGNTDLALSTLPGCMPERKWVAEIRKAAIRASELTNQMLAYSGKGQFVILPIDLNHMVEEMAQLLTASISKKTHLAFRLAEDLPAVEADVTQIRQVVMNLITNASDAIGETGGTVTLSTEVVHIPDKPGLQASLAEGELPPGRYVCLRVADTGCGMDEDTRERIFEPFFTTKFTGRGLGMAAVQGIVRGHGGAIALETGLGEGTTFELLFPASDKPAATAARTEPEPLDMTWRGMGTILVVDDEEGICEVLVAILESFGFDVVTAADGAQGVELFREHANDIACVLLDMTMPRMNGPETFREMRNLCPDVRVILCSGYSEQEAVSRFAGNSLAGFIQKPYQISDLIHELRRVLSNDDAVEDHPGEKTASAPSAE